MRRAASSVGLGLCCDPFPLGQQVWSKCCVFAQVHVPLHRAWDHHRAAASTLQVPGRCVQRRIRAVRSRCWAQLPAPRQEQGSTTQGLRCREPPSPRTNLPLLHRRLFVLLEATQRLLLVAESFHHQRCVLKVEAFLHTRAGGER